MTMSDINDKPLQKALEILEAAALTHDDFTASDTCAAAFATVKARIEAEFEGHDPRVTSLAAYIESLEAERDALRLRIEEMSRMVDAGLQVSAERVIRGE